MRMQCGRICAARCGTHAMRRCGFDANERTHVRTNGDASPLEWEISTSVTRAPRVHRLGLIRDEVIR